MFVLLRCETRVLTAHLSEEGRRLVSYLMLKILDIEINMIEVTF